DLLARPELVFQHDEGGPGPDPERVQLVAGAAGSIGSEVCEQLLAMGTRRLVMLDTDENGLYMLERRLERRFSGRQVVAEVADIRDIPRMQGIFRRHQPRDVFHAAARKHVPLMELAPAEAVKTNIFGTVVLLDVAEAAGVHRFVFTSTDKAVRPTSVMGATKRLGELLVRARNGASKGKRGDRSRTHFSVVRFGNVLDSAGSVVPLFREQIAAGGPVTITHPDAQRYFMTISEAVGLVLKATYAGHGELCVLEMGEPIRIEDLARQMIILAGMVPGVDIHLEYSGLRPGEKLCEELLCDGEVVGEVIDRKIRVVKAPAVGRGLEDPLERLRLAARAEDDVAIRLLLARMVPEYRPLASPAAAESSGAEAQEPELAELEPPPVVA
ncbi:MAG: polysaccharide biosynthesis protein, partial [Holophagales bacterium]|nr:polysaccharide biosynthesis protein [Holophagales bacterium]